MTTPSHHLPGTDAPAVPPPGCPAHSRGLGGLRRLYGPEADQDLAALYEKLRAEHGPVAPALLHNDVPVWVVLGHSENLHMVRTPSLFTRDSRYWSAIQDGTASPDHPLAPIFSWQPMCTFAEGAQHQRLRAAVTSAINTIDHRGIRRFINRYSQRLVNDFCQSGKADLVAQFAEHLPMMVMCRILGTPEEYNDRLVAAARDMIKGTETAIASDEYVTDVMTRLAVRRRNEHADDFAGALVGHESRLTDDEVAAHLRVVLIAGYETTANLIANVLLMVMTDPRFRAQLNGGQMTVPEAVEQILWDQPPFSAMVPYVAKQDTELGGQQVKAGDGLILGIAPGNVDPRVRPDLQAHMQGNRAHLAFSGGPHECPGQDIGRAIADTGVDALLTRLPDVQLAVPEQKLRWASSLMSRHLVELPVVFTPNAPQDVMIRPTAGTARPRPAEWHVTTPVPAGAPGPVPVTGPGPALRRHGGRMAPSADRREAPARSAGPGPVSPSAQSRSQSAPVSAAEARPVSVAAREGAWRRLARWWRGE